MDCGFKIFCAGQSNPLSRQKPRVAAARVRQSGAPLRLSGRWLRSAHNRAPCRIANGAGHIPNRGPTSHPYRREPCHLRAACAFAEDWPAYRSAEAKASKGVAQPSEAGGELPGLGHFVGSGLLGGVHGRSSHRQSNQGFVGAASAWRRLSPVAYGSVRAAIQQGDQADV